MGDEQPKESQQEPREDSLLQTPQPDQAHPPASEQAEEPAPVEDQSLTSDDTP